MSIALDFLLNVFVGTIGFALIIIFIIFAYILSIFIDSLFEAVTKYKNAQKVLDIGMGIVFMIILIAICYGIGADILEKFL